MFPPGSEGFDMNQLLQQAQRMQAEMMSAQQDLAEAQVTGSAGGGLVHAVVTGAGELTSLDIDRSVVDPDDVETLVDLIVAAVRDAQAEIQRLAGEQLGAINAGVEGLLGGAGGAESPLAGLFGGAEEQAIPGSTQPPGHDAGRADDPDRSRDDDNSPEPGSTPPGRDA